MLILMTFYGAHIEFQVLAGLFLTKNTEDTNDQKTIRNYSLSNMLLLSN